jgi:hypothetical protein
VQGLSGKAKTAGQDASKMAASFVKDRPVAALLIAVGVGAILVRMLLPRK